VEEAMNLRGLIIAAIILAGLGGVLYWSQNRKPAEDAATSTPPQPTIIKVDPSDVTQLTIKVKPADPVTVDKNAAGKWEITSPKPYPADAETVYGVLSSLSGLNGDRVVEEKAADLKNYGLDQPAVEVDITGKNHAVRSLLLGDDTPAGGDAYATVAGTGKVFTLPTYNKTSLSKTLNDLRDKSLLTVEADKVSHLELIKKPETIEFSRVKDGWQFLKPSPSPADGDAVDSLVRTLANAKMDLSGTVDAKAAFAKGTPVATAKLTADKGEQTLEVRKSNNDYYAKSSVVDGVYKVDSSLGTALDKKADDFRKKK
jgi:hypothetical protein